MLFRKTNPLRERFERLAEKEMSSVLGLALRLTRDRDRAEDLAMEALLRAYEAFDRFDGRNFKAWILRIVTNLYINQYRARQRESPPVSLEDENLPDPAAPEEAIPDRVLWEGLLSEDVEQALARLPEEFRLAVILSDIEGLSYQEIAEVTGVPLGTVRSRISRGRAILRRELEQFARREGYIKQE